MKAYYADGPATLFHGDCIEVMRGLPDASVDAVVTDPPYDLTSGKKGGTGAASVNLDSPYGHSRIGTGNGSGGFMGKAWDSTGIAFDPATWREALRVLKPGGHLLAFGGSRTWHRLASAVEDAGFEIRDSIAWLYGSGFPKSLDVSKAIDKRPGVMRHGEFARHLAEKREAAGLARADVSEAVVGTRTGACWNWEHHQFPAAKWWPALRDLLDLDDETWGPVIAEAERQKIGSGTSGRTYGMGGLRGVETSSVTYDVTSHATPDAERWQGWGTALKPAFEPIVVGRKPLAGTVASNVLAHGTGALNIDAARVPISDHDRAVIDNMGGFGKAAGFTPNAIYGAFGAVDSKAHAAGRWPTNVVLDDSQAAELDRQSGERGGNSTGPGGVARRAYNANRSVDNVPDSSTPFDYGDTVGASRFFPTFRYEAKAPSSERPKAGGVQHPTVKPLDLMRWLVRLVTPPGGVVLEPFAGSGTTLEAALAEGFSVIGIEREADYLPLIMSRLQKPIEQTLFGGDAA